MSNNPTNISIRVRLPEDDEKNENFVVQEEITILWDRIIAAALLLALLVGLFLVAIQYWRSVEQTSSQLPLAQQGEKSGVIRESQQTPVGVNSAEKVDGLGNQQSTLKIESDSDITTLSPEVNQVPAVRTENDDAGPLFSEHSLSLQAESAPVASEPLEATDLFSPNQPRDAGRTALVEVFSSSVKVARLTTELLDRTPQNDALDVLTVGGELLTVYLFVELEGYRATPVFFNWYQNDRRVARVRVRPKHNVTQTFSSKYIDRNMAGNWRVELHDQQGMLLAQAAFKVVSK